MPRSLHNSNAIRFHCGCNRCCCKCGRVSGGAHHRICGLRILTDFNNCRCIHCSPGGVVRITVVRGRVVGIGAGALGVAVVVVVWVAQVMSFNEPLFRPRHIAAFPELSLLLPIWQFILIRCLCLLLLLSVPLVVYVRHCLNNCVHACSCSRLVVYAVCVRGCSCLKLCMRASCGVRVCWSVCVFVFLFAGLSVHVSVCANLSLSVCAFVCLSVCLCPCVRGSVCLRLCLCVRTVCDHVLGCFC